MKKQTSQRGFITMIIMILAVLIAVIGLVFLRVLHASK